MVEVISNSQYIMIIQKIFYHTRAAVKTAFYKLIYDSRLKIGKGFTYRSGFHVVIEECGVVKIGDDVFFNNYCSVCCLESITIGDGTIFGENVKIYDHNHCYKDTDVPIKEQGYTSAPVNIGKHCWIGSNVTILKGVTIGDYSVIGAGCVIYKDVPPNSVVVNKQDLAIKTKNK